MNSQLELYIYSLMIPVPAGTETVRDFRDEQKWISSDSTMSMPGQKGNLTETVKDVKISPFLLAKYPVTKELYDAVICNTEENVKNTLEANTVPVVNVSWYDAVTFCNLLSRKCGLEEYYVFDQNLGVINEGNTDGYRLPTDAEWQYACRGGSTGYRYGEIGNIAWYADNAEGSLHEVGQKLPNQWGLFDMLGNAWEWCWDLYDEETYGQYRVFRGGSWAEEARGCGATSRRRGHPTFKIDDLGFRVAKSY